MSERRLQFQVGLMVLVAVSIGAGLIIRFGDLHRRWDKRYPLVVHLPTSGGLYPTAPVQMYGIRVGLVRDVTFDDEGGVKAIIEIKQGLTLRADARAVVVRSLLGDCTLDILPGKTGETLLPGDQILGQAAADPMEAVQRLEGRAVQVLDSLVSTSHEWQQVAKNVNHLMDTHRGNLDLVIEQAAESLQQFTLTMRSTNQMITEANKIVGDPRSQQALKETLAGLPALVEDTRRTIAATRYAVDNVNRNLVNLTQVTEPVGKRGDQMAAHLESSLKNLDQLTGELARFTKLVNQQDGSLQKFAADPSLYDNMDRSAQSLAVLLKNVEPLMRDLKEFSDKIARNPELLGVGGAMRPSSGLRDNELLNPAAQQRPAAAQRGTVRSQQ